MTKETRRAILAGFGFEPAVIGRLLEGLSRPLPATCPDVRRTPFPSELFVPDWIACCLDAAGRGAVPALRDVLFQLNFPVAGGISGTEEYQSLALAGSANLSEVRQRLTLEPLKFEQPDGLRLFVHDSGAGLLPVIAPACRADFVALVRALVHRGEPAAVPASMGSSFVSGLTNRRRYLLIREALAAGVLAPGMRDPLLWKDRLLILSSGPYSDVPAAEMGLDEANWSARSFTLRLHHECCHYAMRRVFPTLKFGLQDELVADYAGLVAAVGRFRAEDFLRFMGLERFPAIRPSGRFGNYHRELTAGPSTRDATALLLVEAARNVERFCAGWDDARYACDALRFQCALTHLPLELLASTQAAEWLGAALAESL